MSAFMVRFFVSRISCLSTHCRVASLNASGWGTRAHVWRGVTRSGVRVRVVTRPLGRVVSVVGGRVRVGGRYDQRRLLGACPVSRLGMPRFAAITWAGGQQGIPGGSS